MKLLRIKEENPKNSKKNKNKHLNLKGTPIRLSADFSAETLQAGRELIDIFKMLKGKNCQPRLLYLAKESFRNEEKITF